MTNPSPSLDDDAASLTLEGGSAPATPRVRRMYLLGAGVMIVVVVWGLLYSMMTPPDRKVLSSAKAALQRVKSDKEAQGKASVVLSPRVQERQPAAPKDAPVALMPPRVIKVAPPASMPSVEQPTVGELSQRSVAVAKQFLDRLDAHEQQTQRLQDRITQLEQERDRAYAHQQTSLEYMDHMAQLRHHVRAGTMTEQHLTPFMEDSNLPNDVKEPLMFFADNQDKPILSEAALRDSYDDAVQHYYHTLHHPTPQEGDGWYATLKQYVRSWVQIRKVGAQHTGADDGAIIARAEAALSQGDVAYALEEVQRLSVHASPYFAAWRAQAHRYDAAYRLLDEVEHALIQHMRRALPHSTSSSTH